MNVVPFPEGSQPIASVSSRVARKAMRRSLADQEHRLEAQMCEVGRLELRVADLQDDVRELVGFEQETSLRDLANTRNELDCAVSTAALALGEVNRIRDLAGLSQHALTLIVHAFEASSSTPA